MAGNAAAKVVGLLVRLVPGRVLDLAMRHGFSKPLVLARNVLGRSMASAVDGLKIPRGPLAGMMFAFDPADGKATWMGVHEPKIQDVLLAELGVGQVAFDIGAHLGYMVLVMAKRVGPTGRAIGFEPDPNNLRFLQKNLELNALTWAQASPLALGEHPGSGEIKKGWGSGYTQVTFGDGDVAVSTLDSEVFSGRLPRPDLILIDTEGAELAVLRGGKRLLDEGSPVVVVECHSPDFGHPDIEEGQREQLIELMSAAGYKHEEPDESHLLFRKLST